MRLILIILIFFSGTVLSRYYDKKRFDRSIHNEFKIPNTRKHLIEKQWIFTDFETHFKAYKDREENNCYIEKLEDNSLPEELLEDGIQARKQTSKILFASNVSITKLEAWRMAGGRIADFCNGRTIFLLQSTVPIPEETTDPFYNTLPLDENDIIQKRIADVVSTPLIDRTKRQIVLEERQNLNENFKQSRSRRQAQQPPGRFRGQTQSQYLNIGNDQKEGKAEAEATQQSSRAVVSGNNGMGQAQSMSSGSIGCEDCPQYAGGGPTGRYYPFPSVRTDYVSRKEPGISEIKPQEIPANIITPGIGTTYPGKISGIPGTRTDTGTTYPGAIPGTRPEGGVIYPGAVPGTRPDSGTIYPRTAPGTTTGDRATYPERVLSPDGKIIYPGGAPGITYPGTVPGAAPGTTTGAIYPGGASDTTTYPGTVPGAAPGTTTGAAYPGGPSGATTYPGTVPGTATGTTTGAVYPGGVPGTTTYLGTVPGAAPGTITGAIYPGSVPGTTTYPGTVPGAAPGTTTGAIYPGSVPGATTYPGTVPGIAPGTTTGEVYPGGVPGRVLGITNGAVYAGTPTGTAPGTKIGAIYPGTIPGTVPGTTTGAVYPGAPPGTAPGTVVYPGGVSGMPPSAPTRIIYPGGVPGGVAQYPGTVSTATSRTAVYPGGVPTTGGIVYPEGTTGGGILYPPGTPGIYTGGIVPGAESKATTDSKIYPPGQIPQTQIYGQGPYPPGRVEENVYYPSPQSTLPRGTTTGTATTDTRGLYPGVLGPDGIIRYPGQITTDRVSGQVPGGPTYPERTIPGTTGIFVPDHRYPTGPVTGIQEPSNLQRPEQPGISYPGAIKYPDGSLVPETGKYPDQRGVIPPGYQPGQYPPDSWQGKVPPYTSEKQGVGEQYPGLQYPPGTGPATGTGDTTQYYQKPGVSPGVEDDGSNSQASSSVKQTDSGTQASASAQGKFGQGTAQSQVAGTYTGSGSFSAQAGSSDNNKSVQTEVNGGKEGVASNAQGIGGLGKSQTQVQLNVDSGATTTGAQSSGWNHGTNSQVQASSRGGMADAQANGEGSTSSQAQIGFQPYLKNDENVEKRDRPFRGSGTASAQSGTYTGQSQSQLEGSFQYGITYTGAAQAGSGSGAAGSRKPFNFNLTDGDLFKPFKPSYDPQIEQKNGALSTSTDKVEQGLQTSSTSKRKVVASPRDENSESVVNKPNQTVEKSQTDDTVYDYRDEYEDSEDYDATSDQTSTNSKISKIYAANQNDSSHQLQTIRVATGNRYDVRVKQDTNTAQVENVLQPGQSFSGYTIPPGFRGRVASVAGSETIAHGNGKSQSQTVSLVPKTLNTIHESRSPISETRSLKTNYERLIESHGSSKEKQKNNFPQVKSQQTSLEYSKPVSNVPVRPSYYTVTNSVAGKIDDRNSARKYEHRYYTKSSTCGYFTFSCNVVYGSNGRTKICKPKIPTYPDGTPMKC